MKHLAPSGAGPPTTSKALSHTFERRSHPRHPEAIGVVIAPVARDQDRSSLVHGVDERQGRSELLKKGVPCLWADPAGDRE